MRQRAAGVVPRQVAAGVQSLLARLKVRRWEACLESPANGATIFGAVDISGWAFHRGSAVTKIEISLGDDPPLAITTCTQLRPDVAAAYPRDEVGRPGFRARAAVLGEGPAVLKVRLTCADNSVLLLRRTLHRPGAEGLTNAQPSIAIAPSSQPFQRAIAAMATQWDAELGRPPSVLDWTAGGRVGTALAAATVFGPLSPGADALPYADHSVDVVAVDAGSNREREARRVARSHLLLCAEHDMTTVALSPPRMSGHRTSVVIPVHGRWDLTRDCLAAIWRTVPATWPIEVIVVDDASPDRTREELLTLQAREPRLAIVEHASNRGFGAACNSGARAAHGDILVFLNNDTLPQAGWLQPLVDVFDRVPDAGAVGARLIGIDGTVQEAGAVVFADGSATNLGRGAHLEDPVFARLREVDYCSGAALAVRRDLFDELGGFDERYAPAYYEDTDLAFALRSRGYRVFVQPRSSVIHVEGGTAGTDESQGVKQYQVPHRETFREKWRDALAQQPAPQASLSRSAVRLVSSRNGHVAPRVLVIAPTSPEFDRESGSRRVFHVLQLLREHGCEVTFMAERESPEVRYVEALQQLGIESYAGPGTPGDGPRAIRDPRAFVRETRFDLALLHFWQAAEPYIPIVRESRPSARVIVDSVDLHFLRNFRSRLSHREALSAQDGEAAARELNVYASADRVLTVSAKEASIVNDILGRPDHACVVPDLDDVSLSAVPGRDRRGLLFVGNFRHHPNVEALEWLCRGIVPRLSPIFLARHPVTIVGNDLTTALIERCGGRRSGVIWVGWVPDVMPYLGAARTTIVPLKSGAGTKRKLLQSLMAGTPVVTTGVGAEGLDLVPDQHAVIADSAADFAAAAERLATDDGLWEQLASSGAAHARERHSVDAVRRSLTPLLAMCATTAGEDGRSR